MMFFGVDCQVGGRSGQIRMLAGLAGWAGYLLDRIILFNQQASAGVQARRRGLTLSGIEGMREDGATGGEVGRW